MAPPKLLVFKSTISLILLLFISSFTAVKSSNPSPSHSSPSIYDVLKSHGLPIGLFPKGISNFTVDPTTGWFEVRLDHSCDAKFETHVRYDYNVSGTLSYGQIAGLSGVAALDLFLWFPVKGIRVDIPSSGLICFDVGVVYKRFSLSLFETPRDCTVPDPSSPHADIVLFEDHAQMRQSGKHMNELGPGNVLRVAA